jgi:phosphate butyryltransferase
MNKEFQSIFNKAKQRGRKRFAVAGAASEEVLAATFQAVKMGLMDPILIGSKRLIEQKIKQLKISFSGVPLLDISDETETADRAALLVSQGQADAIMKGNISTPILMKAVLDRRYGLRTGGLLSHIAYMEVPTYHKLFIITDSGMVIRPTLEQKVEILRNAVGFLRKLRINRPKIAVLTANEKVSPHMQETLDAVDLVKIAEGGKLGEVILEGPMALDMAFSKESAKIKGFMSKVAGNPDILLVPDIASGNIFAKALVYLAKAKISGLIVGAKIPIVLISRAEKAETWLRSIALANVTS